MNAMSKTVTWDSKKSNWLRNETKRGGIGFEECAVLIEAGQILDSIPNPSSNYPDQRVFILRIDDYVYLVPYVESDTEIFLKTMYPNRKLTALYLGKKSP